MLYIDQEFLQEKAREADEAAQNKKRETQDECTIRTNSPKFSGLSPETGCGKCRDRAENPNQVQNFL